MNHLRQMILAGYLFAAGCSDGGNPDQDASPQGNASVWQAQEQAYRKAQQVAPVLDEADRRQREQMEQQGG